MDRRHFLQLIAAGVAAPVALAACGGGDGGSSASTQTSAAGGSSSSGNRKVKLGFIALTDCASVVMANELGYFAERDLDVTVEKQASWPALRDALLNGQIDGAHCLSSMPLSVATGIGGAGSTDLKVAMILNQNGQAITLAKQFEGLGYADLEGAKEALAEAGTPSLGMTFPGGTHDTWLRYWLMATGTDLSKVKIDPIPPPQMVQNMTVGNVAGYCVGEPWNAVAVKQDIGFTYLASQDLWQHHPEKALVVNPGLVERDDVIKDLMGAILKASKWLDDPANRSDAADSLGVEAFVNAPAAEIRGRLTGEYDLGGGLGSKTFDGDQMKFFRDGLVNFPRRSHMTWFLAQYQRFGYLDSAPDYSKIIDDVVLTDLYAEVAAAEKIDVPDDDMTPFEIKLDGVTFDPAKPAEEASRK